MRFFLFILFLVLCPYTQAQEPINAVSIKNGARILSSPPSYRISSPQTAQIDNYSVQALIDESPLLWCSQSNHTSHLTFLFELSESYDLEKFVFNNSCQDYKGICAKKVRVELSDVSRATGFALAGEYTLDEHEMNAITFSHIRARWIRLTILSNYGHYEFTELAEFEAWGKFSNPSYDPVDIVGVWDTNFEWVSINSNRNGYIYGCYKWSNGSLYGGEVNRRVFTFTWSQKDDGGKGWCRVVINKEGNMLNGVWGYGNDYRQFGFWEFTKNNGTPYKCWNDEEVKNKPTNRVDVTPSKDSTQKAETADAGSTDYKKIIFSIVDKETGKSIAGNVMFESKGEQPETLSVQASETGATRIRKDVPCTVHVEAPSYMPYSATIGITEDEKESLNDIIRVFKLQKVEAGKTILLDNILFERSKYELLSESYPELDKLVKLMKSNPGMRIELAGHTDNMGDAKLNQELSENRVKAVKKYLVSKGIHADRIESVGYGGSKPLYSNVQEETRKLNRRVEFKVLRME